jgi:tetratricopeptide (TPR) repeat protein
MHPSLLILLLGLLYILGFGGLSFMRRQGLSVRFALEGALITAAGAALALAFPYHPVFFVIVLYFVTMRVRLLVDLGNWFTRRRRWDRALALFSFALRLRPDAVSRQIVGINRGVTELRMGRPEAACATLREVLETEEATPGAKYLSAGYYNLGLACRRTGREAEAVRHFNRAIDLLPSSIYAHGARQALKKKAPDAADEEKGQEES